MKMSNSNAYSGLPKIPGISFGSTVLLHDIVCPFCSSPDAALLAGAITFTATMSGDDLFEGKPQTLAAFLCPRSHVFFVCERDIVPAKPVHAVA